MAHTLKDPSRGFAIRLWLWATSCFWWGLFCGVPISVRYMYNVYIYIYIVFRTIAQELRVYYRQVWFRDRISIRRARDPATKTQQKQNDIIESSGELGRPSPVVQAGED